MTDLKTELVKAERRRLIGFIVAGISMICAAYAIFAYGQWQINNINENIAELNSIILSSDENKTNKKAYTNVSMIPYEFAGYDDSTDSYYFISDGEYLYIAYMSLEDFNNMNTDDIYDNPIRIEGITQSIPDDVEEIAIDVYNEASEEELVNKENFSDYFGTVYINSVITDSSLTPEINAFFILLLILGVVYLGVGVFVVCKFKATKRKYTDAQLYEIEKEINSPEAVYYKKAHLCLTENYIISFNDSVVVAKYDDILCMYPYKKRYYFITIASGIRFFTKDAKLYSIASLASGRKGNKDIINAVWATILDRNPNIMTGYSKETRAFMKKTRQEVRQRKK